MINNQENRDMINFTAVIADPHSNWTRELIQEVGGHVIDLSQHETKELDPLAILDRQVHDDPGSEV